MVRRQNNIIPACLSKKDSIKKLQKKQRLISKDNRCLSRKESRQVFIKIARRIIKPGRPICNAVVRN